MKTPSPHARRLPFFLRVGLAAVFFYAGISKLIEPRAFTAALVAIQIVPFLWAEWIAAILPLAELLTGAWLLAGWRTRAAALAAMLLSTVFVVTVAQALLRGLDFNCHCFGVTTIPPPAWFVILRASVLLACASLLRLFASVTRVEPDLLLVKETG